jgi:hypothetical protein
MATESLAEIKLEDFAACVGKTFEVSSEENGAPLTQLTLQSTAELGNPVVPEGRAPFSLTFEGPAEVPLEQGTYRFSRSDFGAHEIFIVPIGEKENNRTYEAIFS